jgi:hypothetical protein
MVNAGKGSTISQQFFPAIRIVLKGIAQTHSDHDQVLKRGDKHIDNQGKYCELMK